MASGTILLDQDNRIGNFVISAHTTANIYIPNSAYGLLIFNAGNTNSQKALYIYQSTSAGAVFCTKVLETQSLTINTDTPNKLIITFPSTALARRYHYIDLSGGKPLSEYS